MLFEVLKNLFSDKKDSPVFTCFGPFHICVMALFAAVAVLACMYILKKRQNQKKVVDVFIHIAFGLYILDYFLMPFAYGQIDIEKLPFHVCTAMCVMCFISRHSAFWGKCKLQFAMLAFLSNLIYLIYPAGVMWYRVHPLSYRVIQTLSFHGIMMIYGLLVLIFEGKEFLWKRCYKDLAVVVAMTAWAWLGNTFYNSESRLYNWFFVVRDPFYMIPEGIAPYVMPFLNILIFFLAEMLLYFIVGRLGRKFVKENSGKGGT